MNIFLFQVWFCFQFWKMKIIPKRITWYSNGVFSIPEDDVIAITSQIPYSKYSPNVLLSCIYSSFYLNRNRSSPSFTALQCHGARRRVAPGFAGRPPTLVSETSSTKQESGATCSKSWMKILETYWNGLERFEIYWNANIHQYPRFLFWHVGLSQKVIRSQRSELQFWYPPAEKGAQWIGQCRTCQNHCHCHQHHHHHRSS